MDRPSLSIVISIWFRAVLREDAMYNDPMSASVGHHPDCSWVRHDAIDQIEATGWTMSEMAAEIERRCNSKTLYELDLDEFVSVCA